jgi:hypothetical protein
MAHFASVVALIDVATSPFRQTIAVNKSAETVAMTWRDEIDSRFRIMANSAGVFVSHCFGEEKAT